MVMDMEVKHFALELKATDDARTMEGWASTFGNADSDNDIIAPGAFAGSIKAKLPKILWQHRSDHVIGMWDEAKETPQGLYVKGHILETQLGNDAYTFAKAGAVDSMSIGFAIQKYAIDNTSDTRIIQQVDLWEVSLVTFPANEMAKITRVKSKPADERQLEEYLRDAGYSRSEAKAIVAKGYKAIAGQREAEGLDHFETITNLFNQFKL